MSDDEQWYYEISIGTVTRGKHGSVMDRMGPYPDEATAQRALEIARERNDAADTADED